MSYRRISPVDLDTIVSIEKQVHVSPWTHQIFLDCFYSGYCMVAYEPEKIILAYAMMSMAAQEAHILNLAVRAENQKHGIGRQLLLHLIDIALERKTRSIFLEVRASNYAAQHLYEQEGFNTLTIRRDYYPCPKGREDAIIMAREL